MNARLYLKLHAKPKVPESDHLDLSWHISGLLLLAGFGLGVMILVIWSRG